MCAGQPNTPKHVPATRLRFVCFGDKITRPQNYCNLKSEDSIMLNKYISDSKWNCKQSKLPQLALVFAFCEFIQWNVMDKLIERQPFEYTFCNISSFSFLLLYPLVPKLFSAFMFYTTFSMHTIIIFIPTPHLDVFFLILLIVKCKPCWPFRMIICKLFFLWFSKSAFTWPSNNSRILFHVC